VPGVGKSTPSTRSGMTPDRGRPPVAVLAVDPSSSRTGGSILGDKTRMARLANDPNAFIRPSPSSGTLGGVAAKTRETMLLCEAAGFDVILVETVGVGQSETAVADMTDFFLVLMLPAPATSCRASRRASLELADMIAVNKADGDWRWRRSRACWGSEAGIPGVECRLSRHSGRRQDGALLHLSPSPDPRSRSDRPLPAGER
jgi:LAO/AO transport system kinase